MFKLTELMSSNSKKQIRNLATVIFKAFDVRNRILYTNSDLTQIVFFTTAINRIFSKNQ